MELGFEEGDLVKFLHGVAGHVVLVEVGAQLVVRVHVDLLLQLTSDVLVPIILAKMLVQLGVSRLLLISAVLLLLLLSTLLLLLVGEGGLLSLVVKCDDQIVLLGSC